uniref:ATP-binding cassette domain-containing protein n=1 Tax=uncultured Streptococcus sp. TaxID=83427 RepID=UPI0025FE28D9|nr:ABC transporter ATP-binding protein [uncultured Streptococcus sp.]
MKKIGSIYKHYANRKLISLTVVFTLIYAILPVSSVMFLKGFLNYIEGVSNLQLTVVSSAFYLLLSFLGPLLSQIFETELAEFRLSYLVTSYFGKTIDLPIESTVSEKDLITIRNGELFSAQSWKGYQRLMKLVPASLAIISSLILIAIMNDNLTRLFMIVMTLLALLVHYSNGKIPELNQEIDVLAQSQKNYTRFYSSVLTDSKMLREVKSSSYENFVQKKLSDRLLQFYELSTNKINQYGLNLLYISVLSALPYLTGIILILLGVHSRYLRVTDGIFYLSMIKVVQDNISKLLKNGEKIKTDIRLYDLYEDFLCLTTTYQNEVQKVSIGEINKVEFVDVSYKYPNSNQYVLKNIKYCFEFPNRVAIVGESGSGKTTLIKLLCGFIRPTVGQILVNGIDLNKIDLKSYHQQLATVFQKTDFLAFTFRENVLPKSNGSQTKRLDTLVKELEIQDLIKNLPQGIDSHYTKYLSEEGVQLSGGQLQMLLLLRSMMKDSSLYILDEATSAMDINNEVKTIREFLKITSEKMSIIVTHRLLVTKFSDDILVLDNGELVETGKHQELLENNGYYANLYKLQNKGYGEE